MIFRFDNTYVSQLSGPELSDVCCMMAHYHHYIDFVANQHELINSAIIENASKSQKEEWSQYVSMLSYSLTSMVRKFLRTIVVDTNWPLPRLKRLIERSGRLMIENDYEWDVYKKLIHLYAASDRKFKDVFGLLQDSRLHDRLAPNHCGGCSQMAIRCHRHNIEGEYARIVEYKYFPIFDRDTVSASICDPNKNGLIAEFTGKSIDLFNQDTDLYVLHQPRYVWHMWYKRAIDLYFPNKQYKKLGVDVAKFPADQAKRDYMDPNTIEGYAKHDLPRLTNGITRGEMEQGLQHYLIEDEDVSEIQLFLLKMLKII